MNLATRTQWGKRSGTTHGFAGSLLVEPTLRFARDKTVESALQSKSAVERKEAAETLGRRHKIGSYTHLVLALEKEHNHEAKIAILTALKRIGEANHPEAERKTLNLGFLPIQRFMKENIANPALIEKALEAFGYTASDDDDVLSASKEIAKLAGDGHHTKSVRLAQSFGTELLCLH